MPTAEGELRRRTGASERSPSPRPGVRVGALIFDLDGVLIDTEATLYSVWMQVFSEFGCSFTRAEWHALLGTNDGLESPYTWLEQRSSVSLPPRDELRSAIRAKEQEHVAALGPMPGVEDWLAEASELGMAIGVASSSPRSWVSARLEQLRVTDRVHGVVCGGEGHRSKPAPDLYLAACEQLGVAPGRAVAVEDSRNGMLAARAAGLACVVVPNEVTLDMTFDDASYVLGALSEMRLVEVLDLLGQSERPEL